MPAPRRWSVCAQYDSATPPNCTEWVSELVGTPLSSACPCYTTAGSNCYAVNADKTTCTDFTSTPVLTSYCANYQDGGCYSTDYSNCISPGSGGVPCWQWARQYLGPVGSAQCPCATATAGGCYCADPTKTDCYIHVASLHVINSCGGNVHDDPVLDGFDGKQ